MTNWILVLMLFASGIDGGNAISPVSGFISKKECVAAGEEWKATKRDLDRDYVCILATEKP